MHRAYAFLNVKAVDGEKRIITGTATTPTPDRMGDIVDPLGVQFKNPLPLLLYHNSQKPVGWVKFQKPTQDGIDFEAQLPTIDEPGTVKDRIEEAWTSIKTGLLAGVSIGFRSIEEAFNKETMGYRFLKTEVLELSLVAIPAQPDARIDTIKSLDIGRPAASGTDDEVRARKHSPGAAGTHVVHLTTRNPKMKTIAEQIAGFEAKRAASSARILEIQNKASEENRSKDAKEKEEFDTLSAEVTACDAEIADLKSVEVMNKAAAKPVVATDVKTGSDSRAHIVTVSRVDKRPGIGFAKMAMCLAVSKGNLMQALEIAKQAYPNEPEIAAYLKTAVAAGTTANAQAPLLQYTDFLQDFVEYLRPLTIVGKFGTGNIPALRRVPFNVRVSTQTAGGSGYWVGQGKPTPLTKGTYGTITLDFMKVGAIQVLTKEEVRFANPSSEAKVRDDLAAGLVATIDVAFVDPANAGTANVKPASITNGVVGSAVSGTDADAVRVDLKTLIGAMISAGIQPNSVVLIMSQQIALSLTLMRNALGGREFPEMTINGGTLDGFPVIASEHLTSVGSPSTGTLIAVNASDVYLADDGGIGIEASDQASLEMLDQTLLQDGTNGTGASLVSLWQAGLLGLKAEREISWKMRRAAAVAYASPVAYTPST